MSIAHLYKITNNTTGEYYVGKHNGVDQNGYWGSGNRIKRQVKKHGTENFTYKILVIGNTDYIFELEKKVVTVDLIESDNKCLNLVGGGYGISQHTKEHKEKLSKKLKGKIIPDDVRKKISASSIGKKNSPEAILKIKAIRAKQVFTEESFKKRSASISTLTWMNDGTRSYRVRPEKLQAAKEKGYVDGRLMDYLYK